MGEQKEILITEKDYIEVLEHCLKVLNREKICYMEFGCYVGTSMVIANNVFKDRCDQYVAFDSFQGLPKTSEEEHHNVFIDGLYACPYDDFLSNLKKNDFPVEKLIT